MSKASIATGADGLIIEVRPDPIKVFSDEPRSPIQLSKFARLMENLRRFAELIDRVL